MNAYGYSDAVWQRFQNPEHVGTLPENTLDLATFKSEGLNGKAILVVQWGGGVARFKAYGCPVTIALGEWLCEQLEAKGLTAWRELRATEMRLALEMRDDKAHIALIGEDVVKAT